MIVHFLQILVGKKEQFTKWLPTTIHVILLVRTQINRAAHVTSLRSEILKGVSKKKKKRPKIFKQNGSKRVCIGQRPDSTISHLTVGRCLS